VDEIIALLGRRKTLMGVKRRRILEEAEERLLRARAGEVAVDLANDDEVARVTSFCQNPRTAVKMLGRIIQTIPNISGPRIDEEERSEQFWARNRKLENDIDVILEKLKAIDKQVRPPPRSSRRRTAK
jgi:hypothetical protein